MKKHINIFRKKLADVSFQFPFAIKSDVKIITFTFDDVPASAFENAVKILSKYNVNGTFYVALSLMKNERLFTKKDLENCLNSGNELACHTYSHFSFYEATSYQSVADDLAKNQSEFKKLNLNTSLCNFSYPYGEQTRMVKKQVSKLYTTCRGIDPGINSGKVDLNNLKAIQLYEDKNSLKKIEKMISDFKETGGWLIFYTHDVQDNFSKHGCSPAYFEAVVKKVIQLEIEIKSINQVINTLHVEKPLISPF